MCCNDGVFICFVGWDEEVEKSEEFINLLFGKVSVVGGVFYFESVAVFAPSSHYVWQGVEAGVAYWNSDCVVAFLLQKLHEYGFTVEASFAPTAKPYPI